MGITIAIGSFNGGVGSTVFTASLAALLQRQGSGVAMLERDVGAPLTGWTNRRVSLGLGSIAVQNVEKGKTAESSAATYLLADVRASEGLIESMLPTADIWIVPTKLTDTDIVAALRLFEGWSESGSQVSRPRVFAVVFTRLEAGDRAREQTARTMLSVSDPDLILLNQTLSYSTIWDQTYAGYGITELNQRCARVIKNEFMTMCGELFCRALPRLV